MNISKSWYQIGFSKKDILSKMHEAGTYIHLWLSYFGRSNYAVTKLGLEWKGMSIKKCFGKKNIASKVTSAIASSESELVLSYQSGKYWLRVDGGDWRFHRWRVFVEVSLWAPPEGAIAFCWRRGRGGGCWWMGGECKHNIIATFEQFDQIFSYASPRQWVGRWVVVLN